MNNLREADALFVVHRLISPSVLAKYCQRYSHRRALILTSHQPFAYERSAFTAALAPTSTEFVSFADLFDDCELAKIDEAASTRLRGNSFHSMDYGSRYENLVTSLKNSAAWKKLQVRTRHARIYTAHGLGISASTWKKVCAIRIPEKTSQPLKLILRTFMVRLARSKRQIWRAEAQLLQDGIQFYVFQGNLNRLRFKPGIIPQPISLNKALSKPDSIVAVPLHDYTPEIHRLNRPVQIFVDSYLPSNYPRSYLDGFEDVAFVAPDPFSARWLVEHGRSVLPPPHFLATPECAPPAARSIRHIVLLLNHAGDWSALINRSDTDRLVAAFSDLAAAFPLLRFIIRPHPGMNHHRHEGPGAMARIEAFVRTCRLANLEVSNVSLTADLERGDFFISEYSATLISAWQIGKLGMVANFTGRRSFMQDFASLGFPQTDQLSVLHEVLTRFITNSTEFVTAQSSAVARFNLLLRSYLTE